MRKQMAYRPRPVWLRALGYGVGIVVGVLSAWGFLVFLFTI